MNPTTREVLQQQASTLIQNAAVADSAGHINKRDRLIDQYHEICEDLHGLEPLYREVLVGDILEEGDQWRYVDGNAWRTLSYTGSGADHIREGERATKYHQYRRPVKPATDSQMDLADALAQRDKWKAHAEFRSIAFDTLQAQYDSLKRQTDAKIEYLERHIEVEHVASWWKIQEVLPENTDLSLSLCNQVVQFITEHCNGDTEPQYRNLQIGETIEATDEVWSYGMGPWRPVLVSDIGVEFSFEYHRMRRKISVDATPKSETDQIRLRALKTQYDAMTASRDALQAQHDSLKSQSDSAIAERDATIARLKEPPDSRYRDLQIGDDIEPTDEMWSWNTGPWVRVTANNHGTKYRNGLVRMRRKISVDAAPKSE